MQYECLSEMFFQAFDRQSAEMAAKVLIPVCAAKNGTTGPIHFAKMARYLTGNMKTGHILILVRKSRGGKMAETATFDLIVLGCGFIAICVFCSVWEKLRG